jgi:hypothetical protein
VDRIQQLEPPISGGDDFVWVCTPGEGLGFAGVVLFDETGVPALQSRSQSSAAVPEAPKAKLERHLQLLAGEAAVGDTIHDHPG